MTRTLRISAEHMRRFAAVSGDRNPLHADAAFARATPYGRPIAQGALVMIAALAAPDREALERVDTLNVQFKQAVFPDQDYTVALLDSAPGNARIDVVHEGRVAVAITCAFGREEPLPRVVAQPEALLRRSPANPTVEELADGSRSFEEPYRADLDALVGLAEDLGAGHVPPSILLWLAAASYTVGMIAPGEHAVFAGARIASSASDRSGLLEGAVTTADERMGLVNLEVTLHAQEASGAMALQTFLRSPVPPPDRTSVGRYLAPSAELAGKNILVVGGSRGLGAALSGAFATQGATVWAGFAQSVAYVERLRTEFGGETIQPLRFDASDPAEVRTGFASLRESVKTLDGVVLCAAPPLHEASLHTDASASTVRFVDASVAMVLAPLAESLPVLSPDGWLVVVSSSAIEDPPEVWPHYVIAKSAVEGAAAYARRFTNARVLVARPPTMWTDSTNTPLARLGAVAAEQVAAAIVRWTLGEAVPDDEELLAGVRSGKIGSERADS
jgi:NAD(P)-dependent dehydrogenase (short-subunit alcohol dehydrogenase family)/acyl dehydratase